MLLLLVHVTVIQLCNLDQLYCLASCAHKKIIQLKSSKIWQLSYYSNLLNATFMYIVCMITRKTLVTC